MTKRTAITAFLLVLCHIAMHAQSPWKAADIPDSLRQGANSVVRLFTQHTTATSPLSYTTTYHKTVTVLNRNGDGDGCWTCCSDKFKQLTSFSGVIYDANGKQVEKLKKSNLMTTSASENLATDNVYDYYVPPALPYPFTVEYEWQVKATDGYIDFPVFWPVGIRQALQSAEYTLTVPAGMETAVRNSAHLWTTSCNQLDKAAEYKWSMAPMQCIIKENYDEEPLNLMPYVMSEPQTFTFAKTTGSMQDWESFGKWYHSINVGRDQLPAATASKVAELTADCHTTADKIKALYAYLAENTRYVSIQLGIGGWQAMAATEVAQTGFGDCKALTNYMKALLAAVGVEAHPLLVSTTDSRLLPDFPNMHQINHVVLAVPLEGSDTLLIECTNPQLPLGYIPSSIAGHDALLITADGGRLVRIKDYTPQQNNESINAHITVHTDGNADMMFTWDHRGCCYGSVMSLTTYDDAKRKDLIRQWLTLRDATIGSVQISEVAAGMDSHLLVRCQGKARYADAAEERFFLACNPFRHYKPIAAIRKNRMHRIIMDYPLSWNDTIMIAVPADMTVEAMPQSESHANIFGSCAITVSHHADSICIVTSAEFRKGVFAIDHRQEFNDFQKRLSDIIGSQIVLVRKPKS